MKRILRHVGGKDFRKVHQRKLDEQRAFYLERRERQIWELEQEIIIKELSAPYKSDWRSDINEGMTTSDMLSVTLPAIGDVDLADGTWSSPLLSGEGDFNASISGNTITLSGDPSPYVGNSSLRSITGGDEYDTLVVDVTSDGTSYSLSNVDPPAVIYGSGSSSRRFVIPFSGILSLTLSTTGSGTVTFTPKLQRRSPVNVIVGLDHPEATNFIRTDPIMRGLSAQERRKRLEDMLDSGDEYLLKQLGMQGSIARPADTFAQRDWTASAYGLPTDYKERLVKANAYFQKNVGSIPVSLGLHGSESSDRMADLRKQSFKKVGFTDSQIDAIERNNLLQTKFDPSKQMSGVKSSLPTYDPNVSLNRTNVNVDPETFQKLAAQQIAQSRQKQQQVSNNVATSKATSDKSGYMDIKVGDQRITRSYDSDGNYTGADTGWQPDPEYDKQVADNLSKAVAAARAEYLKSGQTVAQRQQSLEKLQAAIKAGTDYASGNKVQQTTSQDKQPQQSSTQTQSGLGNPIQRAIAKNLANYTGPYQGPARVLGQYANNIYNSGGKDGGTITNPLSDDSVRDIVSRINPMDWTDIKTMVKISAQKFLSDFHLTFGSGGYDVKLTNQGIVITDPSYKFGKGGANKLGGLDLPAVGDYAAGPLSVGTVPLGLSLFGTNPPKATAKLQQTIPMSVIKSANPELYKLLKTRVNENYGPQGQVISEKKLKSPKEVVNKIPGYYDGKPAPLGFPDNPPPTPVNGFHPDLVDGKKVADRFNRLDPQSAQAMPPTGNPHIDKKVRAAAKKPK